MFLTLGDVVIGVASLKQASVDFRMEGFHPPFEEFGSTGVFSDINDRKAGIAEGLGRSPC